MLFLTTYDVAMQSQSLSATRVLWFSVFGATLLWFLYWIFFDLIVWNKLLVQVNPMNYLGVMLSLSVMLISGLGVRKIEAVCYLGSTASLLWFLYWILFDVFVWNKSLMEINALNFAGVALSLFIVTIAKIIALKPKKQATIEAAQKRSPVQTRKRKIATKRRV